MTPYGRRLLTWADSSSLLKHSPNFIGLEILLHFSHEPASGPYPEPDESNPQASLLFLRFILILYSQLLLGLPIGLFPFYFHTKITYALRFISMRATFHVSPISSSPLTQSWNSSLCRFLCLRITFSFSGPNILLNTLFPIILSPHSVVNETDQVSHP